MRLRWAKTHLTEAVDLLLSELIAAPGMMKSQEDILSRGRMNGIGPKVLKQAAAKLGIVFERHVHPDIGGLRTYWKLPDRRPADPYPTQKPLKLMERILEISSQANDIVLDAFCGCGTALVAGQNLGRQWVGIDISPTHVV
jgi:DNA modification methylase